ncbi:hypothetical protein [Methyloglobulus sp.]
MYGVEERVAQLTEKGSPLVGLTVRIDSEELRPDINQTYEK